jgi:hypothetical protein
MRGAPQRGFAVDISRINARTSAGVQKFDLRRIAGAS